MTQRPQTADHRPPAKDKFPPHSSRFTYQLFTLALLSGGSLFLEIALTRLFSTLFFPPTVFAIISIAVLGIGLGAALATWRPGWRESSQLPHYLVLAGAGALVLLVTVVWSATVDLLGALLGLVLLPYLFIGLALATIFSASPQASPGLYRADLVGAGLGAVLAIPLLNWLGGINAIMFAAAVFGIAAFLMAYTRQKRPKITLTTTGWPLALCGLAVIGLATNMSTGTQWLRVDMAHLSSAKPITNSLSNGGQIIHTVWDSFARTDLVNPGPDKPYEMYIDGAAGSVMPPAGDVNLLRTDIGFFPFATAQPQQVMIIGPGGGLDIWFALSGRAQSITAVEINPASVEIANQFSTYHGDLYHQPGVRVIIDEGRSVLRREGKKYDLIYLSQVVTLAAERSGYALTENTVYTVNAFVDYLEHLQPGGQIALKLYDELTLTRAMVTAATALQQARGLSQAEAMRHIAVFLDSEAEPPIPLLLVQEQPFSRDDGLTYAGVAAQVDFVPLFVPDVAGGPTLEGILAGERSLADIMANSPSDVSPTTDNRPFFYQFERGLPTSLLPLLWGLGGLVLVGLVGLVVVQRRVGSLLARYAPIYFAALGVGFITVEIALIQQTRLFLGHPTLAITLVLAVLLIGGGIGSDFAGRWPDAVKSKRIIGVTISIVVLVLLWLVIWPWLSQTFLSSPTFMRGLVAAAVLLPLGLLMGIPFPLGLWTVGQAGSGSRHVALGWAVNGVMTVAGSAGAVAVAMLAGFSTVLLVGAGAYTVAAIFAFATLR